MDEQKEFKQIGHVFETDLYITKCPCGELVTQQKMLGTKTGTKELITDAYVAFCKCGNIFVAQKPMAIESVL